jgi:hypothetical protein
MEKKDLKFKVGDRLKHVITEEECVVARVVEQIEKENPTDEEGETIYFYTISPNLKESQMYPAEAAEGCLKKI